MEPVLFIVGLTALHLAVMALIDVLTGARPWPGKLAWVLAILLLPLIGATIYYLRAGKRSKRQQPTSRTMTPGTGLPDEPDPAVRRGSDDG